MEGGVVEKENIAAGAIGVKEGMEGEDEETDTGTEAALTKEATKEMFLNKSLTLSVPPILYLWSPCGEDYSKACSFWPEKSADMNPKFQQCIVQTAQVNKFSFIYAVEKTHKDEKKVVDEVAQMLVFSTMAGSALVYYMRRSSEKKERLVEEALKKVPQKVHDGLQQMQENVSQQVRNELLKELREEARGGQDLKVGLHF
uniref:Uncharacterized protein LOC104229870 n=1 Tax=Nicotiana sylvestris TaxID=4096 RepID=A0A1U7X341_NICSY|nr:PREDICTED: uncharacterized protein LOC104229870 [Nicotiana sylvestris]